MEEINQPSGWPVEETGKASPNHKQEGGKKGTLEGSRICAAHEVKGHRRREPGARRISPGHLCLGCEWGPLLGIVFRPIEQSLGNAQYRCGERRSRSEQGRVSWLTHTPTGRGNIDDTGPAAFRISAYTVHTHGSPVCRSAIALFCPLVCRRPEVTALSARKLLEWTSG